MCVECDACSRQNWEEEERRIINWNVKLTITSGKSNRKKEKKSNAMNEWRPRWLIKKQMNKWNNQSS